MSSTSDSTQGASCWQSIYVSHVDLRKSEDKMILKINTYNVDIKK